MTTDAATESVWHATAGEAPPVTDALAGDINADVVIVGAGFTGLWTAWYLTALRPDARIVVLEARTAGAGASGRNGGWAVAELAGLDAMLASGVTGADRLRHLVRDAVVEIDRTTSEHGIDCHYARGGTLALATNRAQLRRVKARYAHARHHGDTDEEIAWLGAAAARERLAIEGSLGGFWSAHCAAIHPLRLVRGLRAGLLARGVRLFERSPAIGLDTGLVATPAGRVRADTVLVATEAHSVNVPGRERTMLPVHSLMVATEPLDEATWANIGLARRETFDDARHAVIYGQRTADDRLAFGGRGAYFPGSVIREPFPSPDVRFDRVHAALVALLPDLRDVAITHRWGGALGVSRDTRARVGLSPDRRFGFAGGYLGEGVAASNLAGRTLADLVAGEPSERTETPLVTGDFPRWEREPLRTIAFNGVRLLSGWLDHVERRNLPGADWLSRQYARIFGA